MKGLRKKIVVIIVIPLILGLLLTIAAILTTSFIRFPTILNSYAHKLNDDQQTVLQTTSSILASIGNVDYVQQLLNGMNVASDLISSYYFAGLKVKSNFSIQFPNNALLANEYYPNQILYSKSLWYYRNYKFISVFEASATRRLKDAYIIDSFIRPPSTSAHKLIPSLYMTSSLTFSENGLYYQIPSKFFNTSTANNMPECAQNCNYYEPTCSMSYIGTKMQGKSYSTFLPPQNVVGSDLRAQSICRAVYNNTANRLMLVYCIEYFLDNILYQYPDETESSLYYFVIATFENIVVTYKSYTQSQIGNKTITELEFNSNSTKEAKDFTKNILPLFQRPITAMATYMKNGEEMIISVNPILSKFDTNGDNPHGISVGVVMKKKTVQSKFDRLKTECLDTLITQTYIDAILLIFILVLLLFLAFFITSSIVQPIYNLLITLKKMKDGDLDVDILAAYKPSPPEIAQLYDVFDELRVVMKFNKFHLADLNKATMLYSQALNLFISFGNQKAMEICYRDLGLIFMKLEVWEEAADYLFKSLCLTLNNQNYENLEMAKRKAESAEAMIRTAKYKDQALKLCIEAIDTFRIYRGDDVALFFMLNCATALYENRYISDDLIDDIEDAVSYCKVMNKSLIFQRILFIKGLYSRNIGQLKNACQHFISALQDFPIYIPFLRLKIINELNFIFKNNLSIDFPFCDMITNNKDSGKDILFIVSSKLVSGTISWSISDFIRSMLSLNNRISLIQFHSEVSLIFNLTNMQSTCFSLESFRYTNHFVLYDAIIEGIKQFTLNKYYLNALNERNEWIVIITDVGDSGSHVDIEEVKAGLNDSKASLIIINCHAKEIKEFNSLVEVTPFGMVFNIGFDEQVQIVFKEVEAYIFPGKEVLWT